MTDIEVPPLSERAEQICRKRYYQKGDDGQPIEDWAGLCWRVVNYVCKKEDDEFKNKIFELLATRKFLPNSPCLVNAGSNSKSSGLLACFVTESTPDTWKGMVKTIETFGDIARQGGGAGVNLSEIRPEGDPVFGSTHAKACGPIEHLRMISEVMASITQSGFRGMAMLATLSVTHPDILNFIQCKQVARALRTYLREDIHNQFDDMFAGLNDQTKMLLDKFLSNFNLSVLATDDFMRKVEADEEIDLEFNGKTYGVLKAQTIFEAIIDNAWANGDPGLLFYDRLNDSPYRFSGQEVVATNPCGEQPLVQWGSCNLGSLDISKFYRKDIGDIDWPLLKEAIRIAVQFLDDVIDANTFPTSGFEKWSLDNRPIGLGIMGWADLLLDLRMAYGSSTSVEMAHKLGKFLAKHAHKRSVELGLERGTPPACNFIELDYRRNVTLLSIAPTGSISQIAGCSSSIEPLFSTTVFRYDNTGSCEMPHPKKDKRHFRCAVDPENQGREVPWQDHIEMQAAFQKHVDSGISKTINMPSNATKKDVAAAYTLAWQKGCKGITVYRDQSKSTQVLNTKAFAGFALGHNKALDRPKKIPCDIFKTSATVNGHSKDWHIIIGKLNGVPYELFALNGKHSLPSEAFVVRRKRRHYSIVDENDEIIVENIAEGEEEIGSEIAHETRRFSLELRHGIPPVDIIEQISKTSLVMTSFQKAVGRIFRNKYLTIDDIQTLAATQTCPSCAQEGKMVKLIPGGHCFVCPECGSSSCG